jgi:hypothetical protein
MDSEGLYYRPFFPPGGGSTIPWQDILSVKQDDDGVVLTRRTAPRVSINTSVLRGGEGFGKDPIYTAIKEAWRSHGGKP